MPWVKPREFGILQERQLKVNFDLGSSFLQQSTWSWKNESRSKSQNASCRKMIPLFVRVVRSVTSQCCAHHSDNFVLHHNHGDLSPQHLLRWFFDQRVVCKVPPVSSARTVLQSKRQAAQEPSTDSCGLVAGEWVIQRMNNLDTQRTLWRSWNLSFRNFFKIKSKVQWDWRVSSLRLHLDSLTLPCTAQKARRVRSINISLQRAA